MILYTCTNTAVNRVTIIDLPCRCLLQVKDITQRCVESLGGEEPLDMAVSFVRNVATNKDMMRASFRLTADILLSEKCSAKKRKLK